VEDEPGASLLCSAFAPTSLSLCAVPPFVDTTLAHHHRIILTLTVSNHIKGALIDGASSGWNIFNHCPTNCTYSFIGRGHWIRNLPSIVRAIERFFNQISTFMINLHMKLYQAYPSLVD
jgi:hypothetical protein